MSNKSSRKIKKRNKKARTKSKPKIFANKTRQVIHPKKAWNRFGFGWKCISAAIGILGFIFLVYPRVTIAPGATVIRLNPFYTPFILSNDGYVTIYDVSFTCGLDKVVAGNQKNINIVKSKATIAGTEISSLGPGKSSSIPFDRIINPDAPIAEAEITVIVKYKCIIPFQFTETQSFKATLRYNGEMTWVPNEGRNS